MLFADSDDGAGYSFSWARKEPVTRFVNIYVVRKCHLMNKLSARKAVRRATKEDILSIASLHAKTIRRMRSLCPPGFGKAVQSAVKRKEIASLLSDALTAEKTILLACEVGGELAGFALAEFETFKDDLIEAPFLTIVFVETEPRFRRQGVASALLAKLERIAIQKGVHALELAVWVNNPSAIKLYESHGFQPLELRMAKPLP